MCPVFLLSFSFESTSSGPPPRAPQNCFVFSVPRMTSIITSQLSPYFPIRIWYSWSLFSVRNMYMPWRVWPTFFIFLSGFHLLVILVDLPTFPRPLIWSAPGLSTLVYIYACPSPMLVLSSLLTLNSVSMLTSLLLCQVGALGLCQEFQIQGQLPIWLLSLIV